MGQIPTIKLSSINQKLPFFVEFCFQTFADQIWEDHFSSSFLLKFLLVVSVFFVIFLRISSIIFFTF